MGSSHCDGNPELERVSSVEDGHDTSCFVSYFKYVRAIVWSFLGELLNTSVTVNWNDY